MPKRLLFALSVAVMAVHAQSGGSSTVGIARQFASLSSTVGACSAGSVGYNGGNYYACVGGAWAELSAGGGGALTPAQVLINGAGTSLFSNQLGVLGLAALYALPTLGAPTLSANGAAGSTSYTYACTASVGDTNPNGIVSSNGEGYGTPAAIATANATLSSSNSITIQCPAAVTGQVVTNVYRTVSNGTPNTTGLIGTIAPGGTLVDTGLAANTSYYFPYNWPGFAANSNLSVPGFNESNNTYYQQSEHFGAGSHAGGDDDTAVGANAWIYDNNPNSTVVGNNMYIHGSASTAVGQGIYTSGAAGQAIAMGVDVNVSAQATIALGGFVTAYNPNEFLVGDGLSGNTFAITSEVLGSGETSATPPNVTRTITAGAGSNVVGGNHIFQAGNGTGSGGSGSILLQTAPAGASGSSADTMATVLAVNPNNTLGLTASTVAQLPTAAAAGAGAARLVSDASSFTVGPCTGGGSAFMIAISNGSSWSCH